MKRLVFLISVVLVYMNNYAQIDITQYTDSETGLRIEFVVPQVNMNITQGTDGLILDYFEHYNEAEGGKPVLPHKIVFIAIPPGSKVAPRIEMLEEKRYSNVIIKNSPTLIDLGDSTLYEYSSLINTDLYADLSIEKPNIEVQGYHRIREFYVVALKITTHKYDWKKRELVELSRGVLKLDYDSPFLGGSTPSDAKEKFSYDGIILNWREAEKFRTTFTSADSTGDWIDYSKDYLKIGIAQDGVYRIYGQDLSGYGIDIGSINPSSIRFMHQGKEKPLHFQGNQDAVLDPNEYFEFFAQQNYGSSNYRDIVPKGSDYLNYYDLYSDTSFAWITWGGENGKRVFYKSVFNTSLQDTVKSHLAKVHLERDQRLWYYDATAATTQLPMWQEHKVWTWIAFGKNGSASASFLVDSPVPGTSAKFIARGISNAADVYTNSHLMGISVNGSAVLDSIKFDYRQTVNLETTQQSSILINGTNSVKIHGLPTNANFYQVLLDWVDVDYYRFNQMVNDSIRITIPDSVSAAERVVAVYNVSNSPYTIYKVTDGYKKISASNISQGVLTFTDTLKGNDVYYIVGDNRIIKPTLIQSKRFANIRSNPVGSDYIAITSKSFPSVATDYIQFIKSRYNVRTSVVYIEDIIDEFGYGQPSAINTKDFIRYAFSNWTSPKPSYVVFVGDATYDYKSQWSPVPAQKKQNHVFTYGHPVSDPWFVVFEDLSPVFPQLYVGRIPVNSDAEVLRYKQKHETYITRPRDFWNKTALFFSGGDVNNTGELQQIFNANQSVMTDVHLAKPLGGRAQHFYKTVNPLTNFGPFSLAVVNNAIQEGGVYISYVGHSGTQTWDNGVNSVSYLKNKFNNRHPLISDFGCSTGKFAEPDIDAFGELFVRDLTDGQAIAYLGNTSWGYLSTSLRMPRLFYSKLIKDSVIEVGKAHYEAKIQNFQESGINDVNRVLLYCNLLFGDPIVQLGLPQKANYLITESDIYLPETDINESYDSVLFKVVIKNSGSTPVQDSLTLKTEFRNKGVVFATDYIKIASPPLEDTLRLQVPAKGYPGQNELRIVIDPDNLVDEYSKSDNQTAITYTVYSISTRNLLQDSYYSTLINDVTVLNPTSLLPNAIQKMRYRLDTTAVFSNSTETVISYDSLATRISFPSGSLNKRLWLQTKPDIPSVEWSESVSFLNKSVPYTWYADVPSNAAKGYGSTNIGYDSSLSLWSLSDRARKLNLVSAGWYEGSFVSLLIDNRETLPNTYFWGMAAAVLDTVTLEPTSIRYFLYPASTAGPALNSFIDSLPNGTVVAFAICDDGAQSVLGFVSGTIARKALEKMGSLYADSIKYRESWCMLGKKGAPMGSVPEKRNIFFSGPATVEKIITIPADSGHIEFPRIGPASRWGEMAIKRQLPAGTKLITDVYGIKNDGSEALLLKHTSADTALSLTSINPTQYPFIRLQPNFYANNLKQSPVLAVAAVDFDGLPELAINYQVMSLSRDSVMQGETVDVMFDVYNVGFSVAKQFQVVLEGVDPNNARTTLATYQVDTLGKNSKKRFAHTYTAVGQQNKMTFVVTIDPQNAVSELYEDNNSFSRELKITQDTSRPSVFVTFDDIDILDGDFVSSKPTIDVVYNDPSALTAADTGLVQIFLNNTRIYHNDPSITTSFNTANPKIKVQYKPELEDGKYQLKVQYTNPSGSFTDTSGVKKIFTVESQSSLTYVYNYPNPMKDETYFTFKLTTIPKEFFIKIYTIAGRLIREISIPKTDLRHDFNRIYWDGKDQDGDSIANGVYFARFIMKADDKNEIVTQKIAVVK